MADGAKLLLWLLLLSSSSFSFCSELDIECLKILQRSVVDTKGILASSWKFNNVFEGYICRFTGVECFNPDENKVQYLRLSNLGLEGSFPQGLQKCTNMFGLDLSNNSLSGPIPSDISQLAPNLINLDLSFNKFSGPIPLNLADMTYLSTLNLQHNQFSGEIPSQFSSLRRLVSFSVANNLLSGPIPSSLRKFPASNFAANQGLCGAPLDNNCPTRRRLTLRLHRINDASSIGATVGFIVGFEVAFYFPHWFILSERLRPYIVRIFF